MENDVHGTFSANAAREGLPAHQATANLAVLKMEFVLEEFVNAIPLCVSKPIDGGGAGAGEQFPVNQSAHVQVLQSGTAEVPAIFVVQQLCNRLFIQAGQMRPQDGWSVERGLRMGGENLPLIKIMTNFVD